MRSFHIENDKFSELSEWSAKLPQQGYLWISFSRAEFEAGLGQVQDYLQREVGTQIVDLHVLDLLNTQLPSQFAATSGYEMLVIRRLAAGTGSQSLFLDENQGTLGTAQEALQSIDTSPVGFVVFDRILISVHPTDCVIRDFFDARLQQLSHAIESRISAKLPVTTSDLMLRMVNHIIDSYLDLRRLLTRQFSYLQTALFKPGTPFKGWVTLLESRNALHLLEDICEDQRSAVTEWIDAMDELADPANVALRRERELLRIRSKDILEHIERVIGHVRRLESSAEAAVQMHFSAQSHRTNDIMRTLTVLTAIFLPLNLVTGFFGMNFESLPLIHSTKGFWTTFGLLVILGLGLSAFFWRKRYLGGTRSRN
jgi:magnesium transporter